MQSGNPSLPGRALPAASAILAIALALSLGACGSEADRLPAPSPSITDAASEPLSAAAIRQGAPLHATGNSALDRYNHTDRLRPLIADLEYLSSSGDDNASLALSRVYSECSGAIDATLLSAAEIPRERLSALARSSGWLKQRCDGVALTAPEAIARQRHYRDLAAEQGSLVAQIEKTVLSGALVLPDRNFSVEDHRTLVDAVLMQDDGEAYVALAGLMGDTAASRTRQMQPFKVGTQVDEVAWILAGCQKGVPCGADSALLNRMCGQAGMCGYGSVEDTYANGVLTNEEMSEARSRASTIIAMSRKMK
ncbi:TPA: hypothetical protein QEL15_000060 [Stenotrophomonas maltophilia]|nr:hypothetical protein [Stenotrophomonas maltophilia]